MGARPLVALSVRVQDAYGRRILQGVRQYVNAHANWQFASKPSGTLPLLDSKDLYTFAGDGIIAEVIDETSRDLLLDRGCPVVNYSTRMASPGLPSVCLDNEAIGRVGAEHFLERGFQRFAYAGFPRHHHYSLARCRAFTNRLREAGIDQSCIEVFQPDIDDSTMDALSLWLRRLEGPVGVMACNDWRARHVVALALKNGQRVPEEIAVLGVDNDEIQCELADVPISSIDTNNQCVGYEAAALLDKLMRGEIEPDAQNIVQKICPIGVIQRASSDTIPVEDPEIVTALRFIRDHVEDDITVEDLLEVLNISRRSLERRFQQVLGRSPRVEIRRTHVERAKKLLVETDMPMPYVASGSGFPNAERLSVVFRREAGMTPTDYRSKFRHRKAVDQTNGEVDGDGPHNGNGDGHDHGEGGNGRTRQDRKLDAANHLAVTTHSD